MQDYMPAQKGYFENGGWAPLCDDGSFGPDDAVVRQTHELDARGGLGTLRKIELASWMSELWLRTWPKHGTFQAGTRVLLSTGHGG